jgi:hypothetical protein
VEIQNALEDLRDGKKTVLNGVESALAFTDRMPEMMRFTEALHRELSLWQNRGILACAANMDIWHRNPEQLGEWAPLVKDAIVALNLTNSDPEVIAIAQRLIKRGKLACERLRGGQFETMAPRLLSAWIGFMKEIGLSTEQRRQVFTYIPWEERIISNALAMTDDSKALVLIAAELQEIFGWDRSRIEALIGTKEADDVA